MFDDLIKKNNKFLLDKFLPDCYRIYDYGTIYVNFIKKTIEFKGDFKESELKNFSEFINNRYDKNIVNEIFYSGTWTWKENDGKILGENDEKI